MEFRGWMDGAMWLILLGCLVSPWQPRRLAPRGPERFLARSL